MEGIPTVLGMGPLLYLVASFLTGVTSPLSHSQCLRLSPTVRTDSALGSMQTKNMEPPVMIWLELPWPWAWPSWASVSPSVSRSSGQKVSRIP